MSEAGSTPDISVIMPVYNVERFIGRAIQSVLDQTYGNFELLIVNDGTPDKSVAIAETYQAKDARIKILHKPNGGLSDARNFGLHQASGTYTYFIDSDDWIEPNLLELAYTTLEKKNADFIIFGFFKDNENQEGVTTYSEAVTHKNITFTKTDLSNFEISPTLLTMLGYAWNKMYRTSFLLEHNLVFEKGISLVEDILFNSKVMGVTNTILIIDQPLYHYMIRDVETLITTFHKNSFNLILMKMNSLEEFLKAWKVDQDEKFRVLANTIVDGIRYCINNIFAFKNQLSLTEKRQFVQMMLSHPQTKTYINSYQPKSTTDRIYKGLIQSESSRLVTLLCLLKK